MRHEAERHRDESRYWANQANKWEGEALTAPSEAEAQRLRRKAGIARGQAAHWQQEAERAEPETREALENRLEALRKRAAEATSPGDVERFDAALEHAHNALREFDRREAGENADLSWIRPMNEVLHPDDAA